jgi:copper(I)-binding protein
VTAPSPGRRRIGIGLLAVCATLLSSSCATGQQAQTANEVPAVDATSGGVGAIQLHDVALASPPDGKSYRAGDDAELQLVIVNDGRSTDSLLSVSTPAASSYRVFASAAQASAAASPGASTSSSAAPSPSAAPASSAAPSSSAASSPSTAPASSAAAPPAPAPLGVAAGQARAFGVVAADPVLVVHLTRTLFPGPSVPITFTFANAGSVTLPVPVQITPYTGPAGISVPPLSTSVVAG